MARTGYLVVVYQDVNPSSPTYNTTREERTQSEEFCPTSAAAHWIEDTRYCELTENGMLTGYEITVYRDIEPLSPTYNETTTERELNPTECEADETTPNWQNIGESFCRQTVYMPGGLMGNDGYMVQQQQDMNEYSETADEIREIETLDLTNCPLPNTEPVWQTISESCHLVMYQGQLVYDGTKDVIRVNTNQYSLTWNNNIPETANIEDETNCPSAIETQYRWVEVTGQYVCVGFDKHKMEKKQQSTDGGTTWTDVVPSETRAGELIQADSEDCGYEPTYEYRWIVVSGQYECVGYDKYAVEKRQQSTDGGTTWTDVTPLQTRTGSLIETNSEYCGYVPPTPTQYRWVEVTGQYECVGYDKYSVEKKQQSVDGGQTWTDVVPTETRNGSLIEADSEDCGYVPPTPIEYRWVTVSGEYVCVGYDKHAKEKKQQSTDGGTTWTDVVPSETRTGSLIEANSEDCGYVPPSPGYESQYLTFVANENGTFKFASHKTNNMSYSLDNGNTWVVLAKGTNTPTVTAGNKIMWKGTWTTSSTYIEGICTFSSTGDFEVEGNAMSLLFGDNFIGQTDLTGYDYAFSSLFSGCDKLLSAENLILPATTLSLYCYQSMFSSCYTLMFPPELPSMNLSGGCYSVMFSDCESLVNAPDLPATTLANQCYNFMFNNCTNLRTAPELPASTLVTRCYNGMFWGCNGIEYIKCLATDTSATDCTYDWVDSVAASGTFACIRNVSWSMGANGIPRGWSIQYIS